MLFVDERFAYKTDWIILTHLSLTGELIMCTLCFIYFSPSVLDRLNALLEPGGILTIDERGAIDGQIPSIKPHPNFRFV